MIVKTIFMKLLIDLTIILLTPWMISQPPRTGSLNLPKDRFNDHPTPTPAKRRSRKKPDPCEIGREEAASGSMPGDETGLMQMVDFGLSVLAYTIGHLGAGVLARMMLVAGEGFRAWKLRYVRTARDHANRPISLMPFTRGELLQRHWVPACARTRFQAQAAQKSSPQRKLGPMLTR